MASHDTCVVCGAIIPEGCMVCLRCSENDFDRHAKEKADKRRRKERGLRRIAKKQGGLF